MTNAEMILGLIEVRKRLAGGWCQNKMHCMTWSGKDRYCLAAAVWMSSCKDIFPIVVALSETAINYAVKPMTFALYQDDLITWNDKKGRTQQEVLDLVDRTIASLMKVEATQAVRELVEA